MQKPVWKGNFAALHAAPLEDGLLTKELVLTNVNAELRERMRAAEDAGDAGRGGREDAGGAGLAG